MQTIHSFTGHDRYYFDGDLCTYAKGWCQVDSEQDASYFGQWANPVTLEYITYAEGDVTTQKCETDEVFIDLIKKTAQWHKDNDDERFGIDPGWPGKPQTEANIARWTELGFKDLLH